MPITQLDPTAALIVIDLQKGIVALPTVHPAADIVSRSAALARAFRERGLPVVLVNVTGIAPGRNDAAARMPATLPAGWSELVPELDQQSTDILISKQRPGAFIGTTLHQSLEARGVTQVILTGVATSNGVAATARSACDHGYNVLIVTDAVTDRDPEAHTMFVEKIFPRLSETANTESVLAALLPLTEVQSKA